MYKYTILYVGHTHNYDVVVCICICPTSKVCTYRVVYVLSRGWYIHVYIRPTWRVCGECMSVLRKEICVYPSYVRQDMHHVCVLPGVVPEWYVLICVYKHTTTM